MKTLFAKPREGVLVRDPSSGQHLPEDGTKLALTQFMARRLRDGDLIQTLPAAMANGATEKER